MNDDRESIRHNVARNALYHSARRRSFEWWNKIFNFLIVILGTSAAASLSIRFGIEQMWFGIATAVTGAMQLVFDFGGRAREHQSLQKDYYRILAQIELVEEPTPEQCRKWSSAMIELSADEPPTLRAIDAKAYNDTLAGLNAFEIKDERLHIPWWHWLLGGVIPFDGHFYEKMCERRARKKAG